MNHADHIVLFELQEAARLIAGSDDTHFIDKLLQDALRSANQSALSYVMGGTYAARCTLLDPSNRQGVLLARIAQGLLEELHAAGSDDPHVARRQAAFVAMTRITDHVQIHRDELARWLAFRNIESAYDFARKATSQRAHNEPKLSSEQITEAQRRFRKGESESALAEAFDVSRPTIHKAIHGPSPAKKTPKPASVFNHSYVAKRGRK